MKTIPQPMPMKQTGLRLRSDFYRAIKVEAAKRGISAAALIQEGMTAYLKLVLVDEVKGKAGRGVHAA